MNNLNTCCDLEEALKNCERELIHLPAAIQPHGVILALDDKLVVRHASRNADTLFGRSAELLLDRPFANLVGEVQAGRLPTLIGEEDWRRTAITSFTIPGRYHSATFDAQVSHYNGLWLIEIELVEAGDTDLFHSLFIPIRDALWQLDAEFDIRRYTQQVVQQVRLLTGYDRVMMYQFDANWDGEVIAESKADTVGSYLGNRFPASDIPAQARELYTRNLVRMIADVEAEPEPIIPVLTPNTCAPLDMTYSAMRHFSPVHLEYLRNMGVRATLTISLIQNGRLWGLIACHHTQPKYIPLRVRELDEFIGKTVSLKLSDLQNRDKNRFLETTHHLLDKLMSEIRRERDVPAVLGSHYKDLLRLVRASGAVISVDDRRMRFAETPGEVQMDRLECWMRTLPPDTVFYTDNLAQNHPGAVLPNAPISGILVAPLNKRMDSYIAWFRPGIMRTIKWAGNPEKTVRNENGRLHISPRDSFDTWVETVRGNAPAWTRSELDAAKALSLAVIEVLTHSALEASEANYRRLAEYSTDMIAQLDAWGCFSFVSPACETLLGHEVEHMVGRPAETFIAAEDRPVLKAALQKLEAGCPPATVLVRMHCADGDIVWMECSLKPVCERSGELSVVINARDVTQRHTYQLAIEDLHRRNAQILEAAGEGLISFDADGYISFANDRAAQILGRPTSEMLGQRLSALIEADELYDALTRQESLQRESAEFRHASGHPITVRYVCTPMPGLTPAASGGILVFSELPPHAAEKDLSADSAALDQTNEAVMVTDSNSCIVSVNRAFTSITGYTLEEVMGQSPRILKSGVHTPNFYQSLWESLSARGYWAGEIWNRRKNGEIYPQWGSIAAIVGENGSVRNYVAVFSDISKAKQAEERLFYLANHDTLTGLPNRNRFLDHLGSTLDRARRHGHRLAIAFIDLDRFKIINDTLGHAAGDLYLKEISARISSATRDGDMLSRWGGDEFVLLLEKAGDHEHTVGAIQRVLSAITLPLEIDGHELTPTASVGVSLFPDDADNVSDLIKAADTAMYRTKEAGRNGFEFFTQRLSDEIKHKFEIVTELRRAMRNDQLELHYQPQRHALTGELVGLEALARWRHPERGLLLPGTFIPQAEDLGLIGEVGAWVLREACRQMADWVRCGVPVPRIAVNVAPSQLQPGFADLVRQTIEEFSLSPRHLEIEITEGALERSQQVLPILRELRELGVWLSVDDFGTGYSSLAHLKHFPITGLKIDKTFVDGIPANVQDIAIINTILALGVSLDLEVVAEGVETPEQLAFLRTLGTVSIQGYVHSRPLPANQLIFSP